MAEAQAPLLLIGFTLRPATFSSTTIEEQEYKAQYENRKFSKPLFILLWVGIICQLYMLYTEIRNLRKNNMIENGAAAIDELKDGLKLEFTDNGVLELALDKIEENAGDEGETDEPKNADIS